MMKMLARLVSQRNILNVCRLQILRRHLNQQHVRCLASSTWSNYKRCDREEHFDLRFLFALPLLTYFSMKQVDCDSRKDNIDKEECKDHFIIVLMF